MKWKMFFVKLLLFIFLFKYIDFLVLFYEFH